MVDILDGAFPKGECKERGRALVMLSYIEMMLEGMEFNANGEPKETIQEDQLNIGDVVACREGGIGRFVGEGRVLTTPDGRMFALGTLMAPIQRCETRDRAIPSMADVYNARGEKQPWQDELKDLLKANRSEMETGSGEAYWNSVVKVMTEFAKRNPDVEI